MKWILSLVFCLCGVSLPLAPVRAGDRKASTPGAQARSLGDLLYGAREYGPAAAAYARAWYLTRTPVLLWYTGLSHYHSGEFKESIRWLERFLALPERVAADSVAITSHRGSARDLLNELYPKIKRKVRITTVPAGAEVRLQNSCGALVGITPLLLRISALPGTLIINKKGFVPRRLVIPKGVDPLDYRGLRLVKQGRPSRAVPRKAPPPQKAMVRVVPSALPKKRTELSLGLQKIMTTEGMPFGLRFDAARYFGSGLVLAGRYRSWADVGHGWFATASVKLGYDFELFELGARLQRTEAMVEARKNETEAPQQVQFKETRPWIYMRRGGPEELRLSAGVRLTNDRGVVMSGLWVELQLPFRKQLWAFSVEAQWHRVERPEADAVTLPCAQLMVSDRLPIRGALGHPNLYARFHLGLSTLCTDLDARDVKLLVGVGLDYIW